MQWCDDYLTDSFEQVDINECLVNHGGCVPSATCINVDGRSGHVFRRCKCKAGWHGNGVDFCHINQYITSFRVKKSGISHINTNLLARQLQETHILPPGNYEGHLALQFSAVYY
jgi:hypothetical protein